MVWSHPRTGPLSSVDPLPNNLNPSNPSNPDNPEVNPEVNPSPDFVNTKGSVSHPSSLAAG